MDDTSLPLHTRLNLETAPISWVDLGRSFARGRVIQVVNELDLIEVASTLIKDDTARFQQWIDAAQVQHLPDETAKEWAADDSHLWGVVIPPWVLVQNRK